jgi:hypothetical protein
MSPPNTISKIFYQSWDSPLPDIISKQNRLHLPRDYTYKLYNLQEIQDYLQTNWDKPYLDLFNSYQRIPHKIDLWRYCILYETGGIYLDADCILLSDIDTLVNNHNMIFVTNDRGVRDIFNGFLATYPRNPIFKEMIDYMLHMGNNFNDDYYYNCKHLYQVVDRYININLQQQRYISNISGINYKICLLIDKHQKKIKVTNQNIPKIGSGISPKLQDTPPKKYTYLNCGDNYNIVTSKQDTGWMEHDCFVAFYRDTPILIERNHLYPY